VSDSDENTREEVLVGLGRRPDMRALIEAFQKPEVRPSIVETVDFILGHAQETE